MFSIKSCHLSHNQELLDSFLDVYFGSKGDVARKLVRLDSLSSDLRSVGLRKLSKDKVIYIRHIFKTRGATQLQFQELLGIFRESHERSGNNKGAKLNKIQLRNAPMKPLPKPKRDRSPVREFQAKLYEKTNQRLQVNKNPSELVSRGEVAHVIEKIERTAQSIGFNDANESLRQVFHRMDTVRMGAMSKDDFLYGLQQIGVQVERNVSDAVFEELIATRQPHARLTPECCVHYFAERSKLQRESDGKGIQHGHEETSSGGAACSVLSQSLFAVLRQLGEKDSLLDVFRYFDQNLDGKVCVDDMKSGIAKLGEEARVAVTPELLHEVYAIVGLNDNAFLSYNQFRTGFEKLCQYSVNPLKPARDTTNAGANTTAEDQADESYDVLLRIALHLRQSMNTKIARFHDVFNFLDSENLGKLSKKTLGKGLHLMNIPISRRELTQLFNVLDVENSGFVSYSNLEAALHVAEKQRHQLKVTSVEPLSGDLTRGDSETILSQYELKGPAMETPLRGSSDTSSSATLNPVKPKKSFGVKSQQECKQWSGDVLEPKLVPPDTQRVEFLVNAAVYLVDPSIFAVCTQSVFTKLFNDEYHGAIAENIRRVYVDTSEDFFETALDAMRSDTPLIKSCDTKLICWAKAFGLEIDETNRPSKSRSRAKASSREHNLVEKRVSFSVNTNGKPTEVQLREYETLILEKVHGSGKVLLNAYDDRGRAVTLSSTVFDSCAYFHCVSKAKSSSHAKIHVLNQHGTSRKSRAFPGGYRYEFFAVPTCALPTTYHKGSFQTTSQAKVPVKLQLDFIIQINVEQ